MRRATRLPKSAILSEQLQYLKDNSANNKKLAVILWHEQKGYCAYTDEYMSRTDARDVEHFNPTLKYTAQDSYENWLIIKHQWNKEKSAKWATYQPCLHPTAHDFEQRIFYNDGEYVAAENDIAAQNLVKLLQLDDEGLSDKRKSFIKRKKKELANYLGTPEEYFQVLLKDDKYHVDYPRAIREEFGVDILELIN